MLYLKLFSAFSSSYVAIVVNYTFFFFCLLLITMLAAVNLAIPSTGVLFVCFSSGVGLDAAMTTKLRSLCRYFICSH